MENSELINNLENTAPEKTIKQLTGKESSIVDQALILSLREGYGFSDGVINVLLKYVKERVDSSLQWMYIEKVAIWWMKKHVKTLQQAIQESSIDVPSKHDVEPSLILQYLRQQLDLKVSELADMYRSGEKKEYAAAGLEVIGDILKTDLFEKFNLKDNS